MEVPQKIKVWSSNPTSGLLSKDNEYANLKKHIHLKFTAALFTIAKIWKQHKCPSTDEERSSVIY